MTTENFPINPTAFAEAIQELPLSSIYAKVAELRNSIAHLHRSNAELRLFLTESQDPEDEKKEIEGYITENEGVITSIHERIGLLRTELERRGQPSLEEVLGDQNTDQNQDGGSDGLSGAAPGTNGTNGSAAGQRDSSTAQDGEEGVYL
ncbi:hypothetical protein N7492_010136 [Penicillium capsulatum]|uniref:Uncharacterized protein n=1 Tax=Penicillium capsulatum TaxID=69766 RepID=A0A9W9HLU7_9EURO|nr:hypothetical protein N7492_010136 [Penicillium capsulatum]KAJ6112644.1 hypothetical protein N7512_007968 [Penicillium capsulatum]